MDDGAKPLNTITTVEQTSLETLVHQMETPSEFNATKSLPSDVELHSRRG